MGVVIFECFISTSQAFNPPDCPVDNLDAACNAAAAYNPSLVVVISNSVFTVRDSCVANTNLYAVQVLQGPAHPDAGNTPKAFAKVLFLVVHSSGRHL